MKTKIIPESYFYTKKDLKRLVFPLIIEQFLAVVVGICDSMMVASVGEAAVSGVSLVDTIAILIIQLFAAIATGGAVIVGQYLGKKKTDQACKATDQLMIVTILIALGLTAFMYLFRNGIISTVFGSIENSVRYNSDVYYLITMASIPFLAFYNVGAAIFRVMNNSKITMIISLIMNVINVVGNAILIFGFKAGVEGAAIPTLVSRIIAAVIICVLLTDQSRLLHFSSKFSVRLNARLVKNILFIAIPNGIENTIFQIGKLLVMSMVASYGTAAIAANAVCNMLSNFMTLPGVAISAALLPVAAKCVGAGDYNQVKFYTAKLMKWSYVCLTVVNIFIVAVLPMILYIYNLSDEATMMTKKIVYYEFICAIVAWTTSFMLPNTLRASNDVKYCMGVSIFTMWTARIGLSWLLGSYFGLGVFGVWVGMTIDWFVRSIFFIFRYKREKWKIVKEI